MARSRLFGARRALSSVTHDLRQYFLPDIKLHDLLAGNPAPIAPRLHPFIQHARQPLPTLTEMTQVFGPQIVCSLINLTLERQILYEVIASVAMGLRTSSAAHFDWAVKACYQRCVVDQLHEQYDALARACLSQAEQVVMTYLYSADPAPNHPIQFLIDAQQKRGGESTRYPHVILPNEQMLVQAYHDYSMRRVMEDGVRRHVAEQLEVMMHEGRATPLERVLPHKRNTYLICGAAATGKGALLRRLVEEGVTQEMLCRILVDEWHDVLRCVMPHDLGEDPRYHGPLLYEEAVHVRHMIMNRLWREITLGHRVPNTLIETTIPTDKIHFATYAGGTLHGSMTTHRNPKSAMQGCIERFEKTNRLVPLTAMIRGMERLSTTLPRIMVDLLHEPSKGAMAIHDMTYLHPAYGESSASPKAPICIINSAKQKVFIFDIAALLDLHAKQYLDTRGEDVHAICAKLYAMTPQTLVASFKEYYAALLHKMVFVDPQLDLTSFKHNQYDQLDLEAIAYASLEAEGLLKVHRQDVYMSLQEKSETVRLFFSSFQEVTPAPDMPIRRIGFSCR